MPSISTFNSSQGKPDAPVRLRKTTSGLCLVDEISIAAEPTVHEYVRAISEYVRLAPRLTDGQAGSARIALDKAIGRAVAARLTAELPGVTPRRDRIPIAGGVREMGVDLVHAHPYDGLRIAVDIMAVNHSGGGGMWNRLSDTSQFALDIHSKFPVAVVGRVFSMPTWYWERKRGRGPAPRPAGLGRGLAALIPGAETVPAPRHPPENPALPGSVPVAELRTPSGAVFRRRSAEGRVTRFIRQIDATRTRKTEADPAYLLEATAVLVYDPDTAQLREDLPPQGLGLRFEDFLGALAAAHRLRFENGRAMTGHG